eukprot:scaffold744_cov111-Isochrysis_galbana.AAC.11
MELAHQLVQFRHQLIGRRRRHHRRRLGTVAEGCVDRSCLIRQLQPELVVGVHHLPELSVSFVHGSNAGRCLPRPRAQPGARAAVGRALSSRQPHRTAPVATSGAAARSPWQRGHRGSDPTSWPRAASRLGSA